MKPKDIERKIWEIVEYSMDGHPMLRIIKYNGESKFGEFVQIANVEGGGRSLFTRTLGIDFYPLHEIKNVEFVAKNIACYVLSHGLVFE